jgi:hypothetical protein
MPGSEWESLDSLVINFKYDIKNKTAPHGWSGGGEFTNGVYEGIFTLPHNNEVKAHRFQVGERKRYIPVKSEGMFEAKLKPHSGGRRKTRRRSSKRKSTHRQKH